jgi:hypothetical protein
MIAANVDRVPNHTDPGINERIRRETEMRVQFYGSRPDLIPARLRELDREWDIERCLETASASLSLAGMVLGLATGKRKWFFLPLAVQSFFLQHALQGWCPPLPLFRRAGVRTQTEIDEEREALKRIVDRGAKIADESHARPAARRR